MTQKHHKTLVSLLLFLLTLFMANGSGNASSNATVDGISDDIWSKIIPSLDNLALTQLSLTDSKRQKLFDPVLEQRKRERLDHQRQIQTLIEEAQSHFPQCRVCRQVFNASSNDLMKQYLSGFDCDLEYALQYSIGGVFERLCNITTHSAQLLRVTKSLIIYKDKYGLLKPEHRINKANISDEDMVKFDKFYSMHRKMKNFIALIEKMAGEGGVRYVGPTHALQIAMQYIGFKIGYPCICETSFMRKTGAAFYQNVLLAYHSKGFRGLKENRVLYPQRMNHWIMDYGSTPEISQVTDCLIDVLNEVCSAYAYINF